MIYLFLAFFTGAILIIQMYMNSQLSARLDTFNGVFYNYFTAVILFLLYFLLNPDLFTTGIAQLSTADIWMFTGGLIGIAVVVLCNFSFKKLSATYTTSLIILGQLIAAVLIDRYFGIIIGTKEITGILMIASGIAYNSYITSRG